MGRPGCPSESCLHIRSWAPRKIISGDRPEPVTDASRALVQVVALALDPIDGADGKAAVGRGALRDHGVDRAAARSEARRCCESVFINVVRA